VRDRDQGREEIARCQREHGLRARDAELSEQEHGGDEIAEHQGRFVGRNERLDRRQRPLGERRNDREERQRDQDDNNAVRR
jgi:hypothetical protein